MTHDELLEVILHPTDETDLWYFRNALRAVVELHSERDDGNCAWCGFYAYPCPTNQAVERELR